MSAVIGHTIPGHTQLEQLPEASPQESTVEFNGPGPGFSTLPDDTHETAPLFVPASGPTVVRQLNLRISGKHILGVSLLITVAAIWVGASALVQFIFKDSHSTPWLFLTATNVSEFSILLPIEALLVCWRYRKFGSRSKPAALATITSNTATSRSAESSELTPAWTSDFGLVPAFKAAVIIAPIWFFAQSTYNWALAGVSVSTSTVLSTTSCIWTFFLSVFIFGEPFAWTQAAGVIVTVLGALLVSLDRPAGDVISSTWWGISLSLCSALGYGLYTTAIRRLVPEGGAVRIQMMFGFVGLLCFLFLSPVVAGLHVAGVQRVPTLSGALLSLILFKGLADNVLSDLLWAWAIQLTSATLATIGLTLTIPLAMISDLIIHGAVPGPLLAAGSFLAIVGFFLAALSLQQTAVEDTTINGGARSDVRSPGTVIAHAS